MARFARFLPLVLLGLISTVSAACIFDPITELVQAPSRNACYRDQDCDNANSSCVAISMVFYDTFLDCNLLGNNPDGKTGGDDILCDPLLLAYDCLSAKQACIAGCNAGAY